MNGLTKWMAAAVVGMFGALGCSAAPSEPAPGDATVGDEQGVSAHGQFCGGFGNFPCPAGYGCIDDPHDDCDPENGGADCGGMCVRSKKPKKQQCNDPNRTYVATSPEECSLVKFFCAEGEPFFDDCGCGCEVGAGTPCGASTCGTGEYCCNESCGICAPEGGFCTQQYCGPSCGPNDCGPALGLANYLCPDGVTVAGPTGQCLDVGGACGWEVVSCP